MWGFVAIGGFLIVGLVALCIIVYWFDSRWFKARNRWISQYGDAHLKNAIQHGYDCADCYVKARATHELGGAWDVKGGCTYYPRVGCPTEAALKIIDSLGDKGQHAVICWINNQESAVIYSFLNRYTINQQVGGS